MVTIILAASIAVCVSFLCSLMEAALYAVGAPYIRSLVESGSRAGRILERFREDVDRPISAILILNTLANTAGAAVAGAAVASVAADRGWGGNALVLFSVVFTLLILLLGEIVPKVLGVTYNRGVSVFTAYPLLLIMIFFSPVIFVTTRLSRLLRRKAEDNPEASEDEVRAMAAISADEGSILPIEEELIGNVLKLNEVTAGSIMTPRTVVFRKPETMTLREVAADTLGWSFSRVPVHKEDDVDEFTGFALRRDVFSGIAEKRMGTSLADLARAIRFVPELMPGHQLLEEFIKARQHLFAVVDEYGDLTGIVTLEDVLEFILGKEIVDEFDKAVDMQKEARKIHTRTMKKMVANEETAEGEDGSATPGPPSAPPAES